MSRTKIDEVTGAIFIIGLGCLFYFGFWPGILFLIGGIMIIRAMAQNQGSSAYQGAFWIIGIGVWALLEWNFAAMIIMFGVWMLSAALLRRTPTFSKPKPQADNLFD